MPSTITPIPVSEFFRYKVTEPENVQTYLEAGVESGDFKGIVAVGDDNGNLLGIGACGMWRNISGIGKSYTYLTEQRANGIDMTLHSSDNVDNTVSVRREAGYDTYLRMSSTNSNTAYIGIEEAVRGTGVWSSHGLVPDSELDVVCDELFEWEQIAH